jgi:hypothetical protein
MKEQLRALIGMFVKPKQTLLDLPYVKFYWVSFLISLYFGYARAAQKGFFGIVAEKFNSKFLSYVIFLAYGVLSFLLTAFCLKMIVRMFGKDLTFKKIMNIQGYSQVPRLILSLPLSIIILILPKEFAINLGMIKYKGLWTAVTIFGLVLLFYSLFLLVYGLVISPNVVRVNKEN